MVGGMKTFLQIMELLSRCLQYDPTARPSVTECLNHPCFERIRELPRERKYLLMTPEFYRSSIRPRVRQTPSLKDMASFRSSTKAHFQVKYLRKYTYETITNVLNGLVRQSLNDKDEVASILSCSINLFDRDIPLFFKQELEKQSLPSSTVVQMLIFAIATTWLSGKYLSFLCAPTCMAIAKEFDHLCHRDQILEMENKILNQDHFTFPRTFLNTQFSISADLFQILSLNLDNQEEIANEMFSTLLKRASKK